MRFNTCFSALYKLTGKVYKNENKRNYRPNPNLNPRPKVKSRCMPGFLTEDWTQLSEQESFFKENEKVRTFNANIFLINLTCLPANFHENTHDFRCRCLRASSARVCVCEDLKCEDSDAEVERKCRETGDAWTVSNWRQVWETIEQRDGKSNDSQHIGQHWERS